MSLWIRLCNHTYIHTYTCPVAPGGSSAEVQAWRATLSRHWQVCYWQVGPMLLGSTRIHTALTRPLANLPSHDTCLQCHRPGEAQE